MDWLHQIPANWLWSGGFVLAAIAYAARGEIGAGLAFLNPLKPNKTGGSPRAALDLALTLKDHFPADSVGRAAMKQVIEAITAELSA
jgi:hypothetical protein